MQKYNLINKKLTKTLNREPGAVFNLFDHRGMCVGVRLSVSCTTAWHHSLAPQPGTTTLHMWCVTVLEISLPGKTEVFTVMYSGRMSKTEWSFLDLIHFSL